MYALLPINFILIFLLFDFFNGIHQNFLGRKLKYAGIVLGILFASDALICYLSTLIPYAPIVLLVTELLLILSTLFVKIITKEQMRYVPTNDGKETFFGNQSVMVFVPHEDDDINLMGGILEAYQKYGSKVYVVFATNGDGLELEDASTAGRIRLQEAIRVLTFLGIPEDHIIFLGYGDDWNADGPHIYNAPPDEVIHSRANRTETYGLPTHPAYHNGVSYTYAHYYGDLKQIILDYQPDVLYCVDYDTHPDHRALSMLFEKVMGELLKTTAYCPTVYKGYAYRTAWTAPKDFNDSANLTSTVNSKGERDIPLYDWDERVRIPIDVLSISRDLKRSKLYRALSMYRSQKANHCAESVINGDKVFWQRETTSLCYQATISVSSGNGEKLNDFMLLDCDDLKNKGDFPFDGVWHPHADDPEKTARIQFDSPQFVDHIVLYDNPSPENNILDACIITDDGSTIYTGPFRPFGMATTVAIQKTISSFQVQIIDFEGENCGLTEIEAYGNEPQEERALYKFVDEANNFVYDHLIPKDGKQRLGIYCSNNKRIDLRDMNIECSNKKCKLNVEADEIKVYCPRGKKCRITLSSKDYTVYDSIILRNPNRIERFLMRYSLKIDFYIHKILLRVHKIIQKNKYFKRGKENGKNKSV